MFTAKDRAAWTMELKDVNMLNKFILDDNHNVISCEDIMKWAMWMEKTDLHVAYNIVGNSEISTVFLGISYGFGKHVMIFETLIRGGVNDGNVQRYETWEQAIIGHKQWIEKINKL